MLRIKHLLPLALLAPLAAAPAPLPAEAPLPHEMGEAEKALAGMSWLAGTWAGPMWGGQFEAHYSTPEGGRVLSHSRLLRGEEVAFYEFEVFEVKDDVLHLQPYPGGRQAVGFELVSHDAEARRAVFENPEKDYPTRIVYERVAADNLVITLSDPHGGNEKVERFDLLR